MVPWTMCCFLVDSDVKFKLEAVSHVEIQLSVRGIEGEQADKPECCAEDDRRGGEEKFKEKCKPGDPAALLGRLHHQAGPWQLWEDNHQLLKCFKASLDIITILPQNLAPLFLGCIGGVSAPRSLRVTQPR